MAGTCPYCSIRISGQLQHCPECGSYCLASQEECPECHSSLSESFHAPDTPQSFGPPQPATTQEWQSQGLPPIGNIPVEPTFNKPVRKIGIVKRYWKWGVAIFIFILLCAAGCFYYMKQKEQKEQEDYERLRGKTNPEFYQKFLDDHPDSKHYDEIHERMLVLQAEVDDWNALQRNINRSSIARFMQKHPNSIRQRTCEDMLDSIDWQDALTVGTEDAITDYLHRHPSGRYVSDAADRKNTLLLTKVTPEEKAMIRGTLEAFFSRAIAGQDIEAAQAAIPDVMTDFCGKQDASAEDIIEYAREKLADDVIGLHYSIGRQMSVHKETLPDGNTGFAVEVTLHETIGRSNMDLPSENHYRVNALLDHEQKIVKLNIIKQYGTE